MHGVVIDAIDLPNDEQYLLIRFEDGTERWMHNTELVSLDAPLSDD